MRTYIFCLSLFLIPFLASAQDKGVLSISSEGSVELPADIIQFNINLNAEADSPQKAYELHKERENVLVQLLEKYNVEEKDIHFEPVSISKSGQSGRYSEEEPTYQTGQMVTLKIQDFGIYEQMQVTLIQESFDNFSGQFLSSKAAKGKDNALQKAIRTAKEKARLIAEEAGIKLGSITGINYSHNQYEPVFARSKDMMAMGSPESQLLKYDQVVTVTANISINFTIMQQ